MDFLLADMRIFAVEVVISCLNLINTDFPSIFIFDPLLEAVGFIAPPGRFRIKLFNLHRLGFVVAFYAGWVRMFVKPDMLGLGAFAKKQQVGFDASVGRKHAIGQADNAVCQQFFFDAGFDAFAKVDLNLYTAAGVFLVPGACVLCSCAIEAASNPILPSKCSARWPTHLPPPQQMQMQVINFLPAVPIAVDYCPVAPI